MDRKKFAEINSEYDHYYKELLSQGKLPLRSTSRGFWGHVPLQDLYEAFMKLKLDRHKSFLDLGSGDGKVVLLAALFCRNAVGVEIDEELHQKAVEIQERLGIPNASFYNADFYDHNLSAYDAVFVYPDEPLHRNIEKKLLSELRGKLIHCGHHFHPQSLQKENSTMVNGTLLTVYSR